MPAHSSESVAAATSLRVFVIALTKRSIRSLNAISQRNKAKTEIAASTSKWRDFSGSRIRPERRHERIGAQFCATDAPIKARVAN
jgi:hypothetical protein